MGPAVCFLHSTETGTFRWPKALRTRPRKDSIVRTCHASDFSEIKGTTIKVGQEQCPGKGTPAFRLPACSETYGATLGTPSLMAKSMYCPGGATLLLGGPAQATAFPEDALQSSTTCARILRLCYHKIEV